MCKLHAPFRTLRVTRVMSKRILIIEDNEAIRLNTSELLELEGYEVLVACNGAEGLEIAKKELPNIILCDIMMPVMDGYSVLQAVRSYEPLKTTPFLFFTAYSEKCEIEKGMRLGADDYIVKPADTEMFISKISKFVR